MGSVGELSFGEISLTELSIGRRSCIGTASINFCISFIDVSAELSKAAVGVVELFVLVGKISAALTEGSVGELSLAEKSFESNGAVEFV